MEEQKCKCHVYITCHVHIANEDAFSTSQYKLGTQIIFEYLETIGKVVGSLCLIPDLLTPDLLNYGVSYPLRLHH